MSAVRKNGHIHFLVELQFFSIRTTFGMIAFVFLKAFLRAILDFITTTWKFKNPKMIASFTTAFIIFDENISLILSF